MLKVPVYNQEGAAIGEHELPPEIFSIPVNPSLIHHVAVAQASNARRAIAHTKQRGDVRGGGRKPWKQKHTGRARHGSTRSPLWRHGGVVFGPRNDRNAQKEVSKIMKRNALCMVLSDKVHDAHLILLDQLTIPDGKTKTMVSFVHRLPKKEKTGKVLVALDRSDALVHRAARNVPYVFTTDARSLNVLDLLAYPYFVTTVKGVEAIREQWGKKKVKNEKS